MLPLTFHRAGCVCVRFCSGTMGSPAIIYCFWQLGSFAPEYFSPPVTGTEPVENRAVPAAVIPSLHYAERTCLF